MKLLRIKSNYFQFMKASIHDRNHQRQYLKGADQPLLFPFPDSINDILNTKIFLRKGEGRTGVRQESRILLRSKEELMVHTDTLVIEITRKCNYRYNALPTW